MTAVVLNATAGQAVLRDCRKGTAWSLLRGQQGDCPRGRRTLGASWGRRRGGRPEPASTRRPCPRTCEDTQGERAREETEEVGMWPLHSLALLSILGGCEVHRGRICVLGPGSPGPGPE
ncbi:hypothetical protein TREES_T100009682 [Tupaia chinensis]|uniref:Uncharacterized protein n=1 Tax=Tupaia chinensis TaxID=246437 RepID=L9L398_TUPCH|nr:hypothetical protein TREES_T100009682 [Tupaia chinensis]